MTCSELSGYSTVCEECDWVNSTSVFVVGEALVCERCCHTLARFPKHRLEKILAYGCVALIMLILSLSFSFLNLSTAGFGRTVTFWQSLSTLLNPQFFILGIFIVVILLVLPIFFLVGVVMLSWLMKRERYKFVQRRFLYSVIVIKPWLMVDVFLVGVLVALVKMQTMVTIGLGFSFWAFLGYVVCLVKTASLVDYRWFWWKVLGPIKQVKSRLISARLQGLVGCYSCGAIVLQDRRRCSHCGHKVYSRKPSSIKRTAILLVVTSILFVTANVLPIMQTRLIGMTESSTIIGGVYQLWGIGSYLIAIIILLASVFIPIAKILSLGWLCWHSSSSEPQHLVRKKRRLYRITKMIGRWSMIDVFVVVTLTGLIQVNGIISVEPGLGALAFSSVVILTMLAARTYDSRLLWDKEA